jgi:hypothetical protein
MRFPGKINRCVANLTTFLTQSNLVRREKEFELISMRGKIGPKIADGTWHTIINRISGSANPNSVSLS